MRLRNIRFRSRTITGNSAKFANDREYCCAGTIIDCANYLKIAVTGDSIRHWTCAFGKRIGMEFDRKDFDDLELDLEFQDR